jgi:hypothetical protein
MMRLLVMLIATMTLAGDQQTRPQDQRADDPDYRRPADAIPPFQLSYLAGTWTFEWDVPDSIFGPGGTITGTEMVTCKADGKSCDSTVRGALPEGAFSQAVTIAYDEGTRMMTRVERDSRGFDVRYVGQLSSDQGFHQIAFASEPFRYQGRTLRLKSTASMTAPAAYRVRYQLSIDDGAFENFGAPWWRKR